MYVQYVISADVLAIFLCFVGEIVMASRSSKENPKWILSCLYIPCRAYLVARALHVGRIKQAASYILNAVSPEKYPDCWHYLLL